MSALRNFHITLFTCVHYSLQLQRTKDEEQLQITAHIRLQSPSQRRKVILNRSIVLPFIGFRPSQGSLIMLVSEFCCLAYKRNKEERGNRVLPLLVNLSKSH